MSKKPASLTSDLLARKGEAEPSTIDPEARATLSAGPGFSAYGGGGGGRDDESGGEETRPLPPEPEIIYTAEETGGGGGSTRLIIGAVLILIAIGGIFLVTTGKERGVAPVSPDIAMQTPVESPAASQQTAAPQNAAPEATAPETTTPETTAPETVTAIPGAPDLATPNGAAPDTATHDLRPAAPVEESAPQAGTPAAPPVAAVEVPTAPVKAAKPVEEAALAAKPATTVRPSSGGAYVVQLFALKDEAAAKASWTLLMKKHGDVLTGHARDIEKADLGAKGVWYRVRAAGFATRAAAIDACAKLKASGQDCMVKKR